MISVTFSFCSYLFFPQMTGFSTLSTAHKTQTQNTKSKILFLGIWFYPRLIFEMVLIIVFPNCIFFLIRPSYPPFWALLLFWASRCGGLPSSVSGSAPAIFEPNSADRDGVSAFLLLNLLHTAFNLIKKLKHLIQLTTANGLRQASSPVHPSTRLHV